MILRTVKPLRIKLKSRDVGSRETLSAQRAVSGQ